MTRCALALTLLLGTALPTLAARAEVAGTAATSGVAVVEQPAPEEDVDDVGLFLQAFGGLGLPVTGPLADAGAWGLWGGVTVGLGYKYGIAGFVELGLRHHPMQPGYVSTQGGLFDAFGILVGGRLTTMEDFAVHPFGEAGLGAHLVSAGAAADGVLRSPTAVFALLCSAGLQLDITANLSIEGILRADLLFTRAIWPESSPSPQRGNTLFLTPELRGSLYF